MSNSFGIKISKSGYDAKTASQKDLTFDSSLDTLKISKTGSIYIDLPEEALSSSSKTYTATYAHGLGYVPLIFPPIRDIKYPGDITTGGDWSVNEIYYAYLPGEGTIYIILDEIATIQSSSTYITLKVTRYDSLSTGITFGERRVTYNYNIFSNSATEEYNYLD